MIELRPRQAKAIADVRAAFASGHRAPVLVAPTGAGKTFTAIEIVRLSISRGHSVWFLAHLREILDDTSARLTAAGIGHGSIRAGRSSDYSQPVQVVAVQTAVRRQRLPRPGLIIVDECHLAVANSYRQVIAAAGSPRLLGLTGTPQRLDGRGLGEVFDLLVHTCSTAELIDEGLLAPIRIFAPPGADLSGIGRRGGDFDQGAAGVVMNRPQVVGDALSHWQKLCQGRRGVCFCTTVSHAQAVAEQWQRAGYRAVAVHGGSDDAERREAVAGLRAGRLDLVACAQLWIAGVDVPEIDAVIWLRPTQSLTAWLQGNGRGLRCAPGKQDLLILDHVGNSARLGHPLTVHDWTLEGRVKRRTGERPLNIRVCPACFAAMRSGTPQCPECGHQFVPERRELQHVEGQLEEVIARRERRAEQSSAQSFEDLVRIGHRRGMANPRGWARHVLAAREAKRERVA
ncbi:MAG: DEAD/DEAH box helicase [Betaproteobacteria bacterium]|nr:DEAD/DEAH box helicase [Betaproteobacteria bacterium]